MDRIDELLIEIDMAEKKFQDSGINGESYEVNGSDLNDIICRAFPEIRAELERLRKLEKDNKMTVS